MQDVAQTGKESVRPCVVTTVAIFPWCRNLSLERREAHQKESEMTRHYLEGHHLYRQEKSDPRVLGKTIQTLNIMKDLALFESQLKNREYMQEIW